MRVKSIEYENFRNFKDRGKIICSTDGRVTIIYGKNGDGKTTLHQLFQWIFYGKVNFNKTTTDRLYNLKFESECPVNTQFEVMGRIEFEHAGEEYLVRRSQYYEKTLFDGSIPRSAEFEIQKKDNDNNWKTLNGNPADTIEKLLPSGLSDYFFFDGESMIADLRVKGVDSAKKLRTALYSMFELDILDMAIDHLGDTKSKTTAIGKLYDKKGADVSGSEIAAVKTNIDTVRRLQDKCQRDLKDDKTEREEKSREVKEISEQIGTTKSRADFESQRKICQEQQALCQQNVETAQLEFGEKLSDTYPMLLISKAVKDAKTKIKLKVNNTKLPPGLNKTLINYLLKEITSTCICGSPLCEEEKDHIREYLKLLPPKSYASLYQNFSDRARVLGQSYDREDLEKYIIQAFKNLDQAEKCEDMIHNIDVEQKKSADIEALVIARQVAESRIKELNANISKLEFNLKKAEAKLKIEMDKYDKLAENNENAIYIQKQIDILYAVKQCFVDRLTDASETYSQRLQENIQDLLNTMLTSKRKVSVTSEFAVRVYDSFEDESKSEGQFAIVSFAYIGGILKMLKSEAHLADKEYPLVLDGPFSKLDPDQRQNVVDIIPQFAPQVILFSKDSLQDVFSSEQIGRIYTISSNEEKNIATVKEGYHWN